MIKDLHFLPSPSQENSIKFSEKGSSHHTHTQTPPKFLVLNYCYIMNFFPILLKLTLNSTQRYQELAAFRNRMFQL